jgi:hypothetical protein
LHRIVEALARIDRDGDAATQAPDLTLWKQGRRIMFAQHMTWTQVLQSLGLLNLGVVAPIGVNVGILLLPTADYSASFWDNWVYNWLVWPLFTMTSELFTIAWFYLMCSGEILNARTKRMMIACVFVSYGVATGLNVPYVLLVWNGTQPVPGHAATMPSVMFSVFAVLLPLVMWRGALRSSRHVSKRPTSDSRGGGLPYTSAAPRYTAPVHTAAATVVHLIGSSVLSGLATPGSDEYTRTRAAITIQKAYFTLEWRR